MTDVIAPNSHVTLHFSIALMNGELVDSNFDKNPASFVVGDGNLPPGFEQVVIGMAVGERKRVEIAPEQAFGVRQEANLQWLAKQSFDAQFELKPGLVVLFADANQQELPGVVKCIEGERVQVDFNHPLAGETLVFEVQILAISNASDAQEEIPA